MTALVLPKEIHLHYLKKTWEIVCDPHLPTQKACEDRHHLFLPIPARHTHKAVELLKIWLRQKAWLHLPQHLYELSVSHKLPFSGLTIRNQRTRWGSCSADKKINLNSKLLFLPKHLVDYVIIHELCHTKFLDHSENFWNLVEHHMPHYKRLDGEVRKESHWVPAWFAVM